MPSCFLQVLDENTVRIIEKWESLKALRVHLKSPHMLAYRREVKVLVEGTELKVLKDA
ncbi:MAG: antibiotic biosynthesis monooxygenase [SAR324 cluster bacterium]|nr:antibiotic biosynthesis monooxygenase [SAR324 cluster bacterium]